MTDKEPWTWDAVLKGIGLALTGGGMYAAWQKRKSDAHEKSLVKEAEVQGIINIIQNDVSALQKGLAKIDGHIEKIFDLLHAQDEKREEGQERTAIMQSDLAVLKSEVHRLTRAL